MTKRTRRAIDAALNAKIALEALREQATVHDLVQRYDVHPNQIYSWKKQLQEQAARTFDSGVGKDAEAGREREIEKLTPHWRATLARSGVDWETDTLRQRLLGRCVRITGWLLFDREHRGQSENTARPGEGVWRATAWELHPITRIETRASCPR